MNSKLRKKLEERKKKLKDGGKGNMVFVKADETKRVRVLPVGGEEEFGREVMQFFFSKEIGGIISPKSVDQPCPVLEKYEELKDSKDEDDSELAGKLRPKTKFVIPVIVKKDKAGKEVDEQLGVRLMMIPKGVYQQMIDLFLEPEQGDFTHAEEGYDLKITRTGSGQFDTEYSVVPCKPSPTPKKYRKPVNIEELLTKEIPTYEAAQEMLNKFLGVDNEDDDEDDDNPKKKKLKKKKKDLSKKEGFKKKKKKLG
jgi:hypothetical protein